MYRDGNPFQQGVARALTQPWSQQRKRKPIGAHLTTFNISSTGLAKCHSQNRDCMWTTRLEAMGQKPSTSDDPKAATPREFML